MSGIEPLATTVLPVMIGTAGHVDHGKTTLVRMLTGCETDTLKQERERGMTIDLGFAPCRLPGARLAGIVDVPGHEDFVRNMVAGAASVDVLLLVVAADGGIMPQTVEHLRIVSLLRAPRVLAVITKSDLVPPEHLAELSARVSDFLAAAGFAGAPVLPCSCVDFSGLSQVREHLHRLIGEVDKPVDERAFRMYVERVFSVKGYGTVVTGVPVSGVAEPGRQLALKGRGCTLRAVQSYRLERPLALAGACCALNLREVEKLDTRRGDCVHAPDLYWETGAAVLRLHNAHDGYVFKRLSPARFHCGTFSTNASIKLLDRASLPPGATAFAHVKLEHPCVLAAGDRYLLRSFSPATTVGGGQVLSARDYRIRTQDVDLARRLSEAAHACEAGEYFLAELLAGDTWVLPSLAAAARLAHLPEAAVALKLRTLVEAGALLPLSDGSWIIAGRKGAVLARAEKELLRFHAKRPQAWGMEPEQVCALFSLPVESFAALGNILCAEGAFRIVKGRLALRDFTPVLSDKQTEQLARLEEFINSCGLQPPSLGDIRKHLGLSESEARLYTRLLADEGRAVYVDNHMLPAALYEECRRKLAGLFAQVEVLGIKEWREATGLSRNFAVSLLEHFDALKITRRVDGGRVLLDNRLP